MKTILIISVASFLVFSGALALDKKTFHGDKVVRVFPKTEGQHLLLSTFRMRPNEAFDFWTEPVAPHVPVDIHVNKDAFPDFAAELTKAGLHFNVSIPDLQQLIEKTEAASLNHRRRRSATGRTDIVGTFARYDDMVSWMSSMCSSYSSLASCDTLGTSFEGRELRYIRLGANAGTGKKEIFFESGIHAREWLSPATMVYTVNRLLTTYGSDATAKRMLDTFDFYFLLSANPDGYEYSHTSDRMWRKTRSKRSGTFCYGVDPNRNFDIYWASSGSSSSSCSDIYHGPSAFSEPETKAIGEFVDAHKDSLLAYFAVHTYSQMWLIPYANRRGNYPPDFDELKRVADLGADALMAVNNKKWEVGNTVDVLSAAAGGGDDYAKSKGVVYSYTLELRPSSRALNGFVVDESEIDPSGQEVWAGLTTAFDNMQH